MAKMNFPTNPLLNDVVQLGEQQWKWDGTKWRKLIQSGEVVTAVNEQTGEVTLHKSDIGLADVENFPVATQVEAEAGTHNGRYMTPLRTKEAILELSPPTDLTQVSTDIVPNADEAYDLGSSTNKWRDLYLSGSTINLGTIQLKDEAGKLGVLAADGTTPVEVELKDGSVTDAKLSNTTGQIKNTVSTHIADSTIHFTQSQISITESQISDLGSYEPANANIQAHISSTNNPHSVTAAQVGAEPAFTKNTGFNKDFGSTAGTVVEGNDARLSNARTPLAHTHGNITDDGKIGTASDQVVVTTTSGVLTTASRSGIDSRSTFPPDSHTHTFASLTSKPTTLSGYGITDADTSSQVDTKITNAVEALVNGASAAFDTLKEIQDAMATDAELAAAISGLTIGNGTQTISAGGGISGGGSFTANQTGNSSVTISHADTSSQGSLTASGRTYVTGVTLDTYGHITGLTTGTETVVDTNTVTSIRRDNTGTYRTGNINLVGGTNVTITETSAGVFSFSSTDTNTVYSHPTYAGDDIDIDTGALSGATVISDLDFNITTDTLGHVTDANATFSTRNITAADIGAAPASHTHAYLPLSGGTLTGTLTSRAINMQNYDITGINALAFNDPGVNEGISWNGGNFSIFESPDNLTNAAGNLQFVSGGARRLTVDTSGNVYANGGSGIFQGSEFRITDSNTRLIEGGGNALRMQTNSGYIDIGAMNGSHAHIYTDRATFYFNKDLLVNGQSVILGNDSRLSDARTPTSHTHTLGYYSSDFTTNLNTLYSTGQFGFSPSTTGRPEDYGQGINIVNQGTAHNNANNWITQLAFGTNGNTGYFRTKVNANGWGSWHTLVHSGNIGSQSVNYANSAGSANSVAWNNVTGKPTIPTNNNQLTNGAGYTTYSANQAVNTSSNVTFNEIYSNSWFRNNNANTGLYNQATQAHWYSRAAGNFTLYTTGAASEIRFETASQTRRGSVYADNGNNIGFLDESGNWALRIDDTVNTILTGDLYGKSVNNAWSNLYRWGGIFFTWDSDDYGTNTHHSIRSTYGDTFQDSITMNSFNHIRFNIDANNNNSGSVFEVGRDTTGTGNVLFQVNDSGNMLFTGTLTQGTVPWARISGAPAFVTSSGVTSVATGGGLTGGTITSTGTISHADTSSQASVNNSGSTYIQDVTLDTYGHVTGLTSAAIAFPVTSVNGLTGAAILEEIIQATTTLNSRQYGRTYGRAIIDSTGTRLRIATGFFSPPSSGSTTVAFSTTFSVRPSVVAFPVHAASTTTTAVVAKATSITTTGATIITSFVTPTTSGRPATGETYGWIAIGY